MEKQKPRINSNRDMKSPKAHFLNNDLISGLLMFLCILASSNLSTVNANSDHCKDRIFAKTFNTSYMQFTKEFVNEEYAIEGEFKNLHCCAKGYRSIEWLKDGKSYPWSSESTSSLILYPQAANQTIYARRASKTDEGRYTCVLRNDTHKIEHQIVLKVLESSPDVPLATFTPQNQFADIGGSARFFCEAFVGKKDLPDISISIKWYHMSDGNQDDVINDNQQEVVKREEEEIIGSYLTISEVTSSHFGRYLCRVEMGNSQTHRLEMSAELINALPIETNNFIFLNPYLLASCAFVITLIGFFLFLRSRQFLSKYFISFKSTEHEFLNMKVKNFDEPTTVLKLKKVSPQKRQSRDDTRIMIESV
ncbi:CLUMA_CG005509, isoform A [Clunio marinus]|uniref:Soluble interferon alpha/beta receptor OPG204 n=1 Tax=Clunio marinus TaxID=568069 RepID=A0A1J1I0H0_9DIPT|nr:CLUMA_CG005509, isoform A [Clunio marinus]